MCSEARPDIPVMFTEVRDWIYTHWANSQEPLLSWSLELALVCTSRHYRQPSLALDSALLLLAGAAAWPGNPKHLNPALPSPSPYVCQQVLLPGPAHP